VVWEQWILRVVVNNTPRPMGEDEASVIERQRIQVNMSCMRRCDTVAGLDLHSHCRRLIDCCKLHSIGHSRGNVASSTTQSI